MLAIDCESTGLDHRHGCRPFFVSVYDGKSDPSFWQWHVDPMTRTVLCDVDELKEIVDIIHSADSIVMHNGKFDVGMITALCKDYKIKLRWPWKKTHDTIIAAHLLHSNRPKSLTDIASDWLGWDIKPYEDILREAIMDCRKIIQSARGRVKRFNEKGEGLFAFEDERLDSLKEKGGIDLLEEWRIGEDTDPMLPSGGGWGSDFWLPRATAKHQELPEDDVYWHALADYANHDTPVTFHAWERMKAEIEAQGLWAHYEEGMKVALVVQEMESQPITINRDHTLEIKEQYLRSTERSHAICLSLADDEIDKLPVSGRSNALEKVIFGKFGLKSPKQTKKGNDSMDKYVLDEWLNTLDPCSKQWHFINHLKKYRKRMTSLGYIKTYEKFQIGREDFDAWADLYMTINQVGTDTLRFSMSNPNGQQISKQEIKDDGEEGHSARYMFGPAPGREWWSLDYENIELRIPAYTAGEELMIDLFERPNDPPYYGSYHILIFDILHPDKFAKHGMAVKDVYSDSWYGWTKNGNFAVQYGAVAESGTADRAYHVQGAQKIIETRLTKIKALSSRMIHSANQTGYVETLPDKTTGMGRGYPLWCSRTERGGVKPTVPLSYMIQGSAMGCTRRAMVRCNEQCQKWSAAEKKTYRLGMQIHDEIVFDFPSGGQKNVGKVLKLKELMEKSGDDIGIPLKVSVKYNPVSWDKGIKISDIPSIKV